MLSEYVPSCLPAMTVFTTCFLFRLLVSASQDGKLIIWDSYTTNKVRLTVKLIIIKEGSTIYCDFDCIALVDINLTVDFSRKECSSVLSVLYVKMCTANRGRQRGS